MPIQVSWDDTRKSTVRWDFEGRFTMEDFWSAQAISAELGWSVEYDVDVLVVVSKSTTMPQGLFSALTSVNSRMDRDASERGFDGMVVVVAANGFVEMLVQMMRRVVGAKRWYTAKTVEVAREIIRNSRTSP